MSTVVVQSPEHFKEPRCGNCGKPMRHNVPHLGPGGGWVHTDTGQATCGPRVELPMNAPKLTAPGKVETRHRVLSKNMGCSSPGASQALADFESEVIARHTNPFFLYANDPVFHAFVKAREEQAVAHYRSVECRNDSALIRLRGLI